jgi:hypothetical protein
MIKYFTFILCSVELYILSNNFALALWPLHFNITLRYMKGFKQVEKCLDEK